MDVSHCHVGACDTNVSGLFVARRSRTLSHFAQSALFVQLSCNVGRICYRKSGVCRPRHPIACCANQPSRAVMPRSDPCCFRHQAGSCIHQLAILLYEVNPTAPPQSRWQKRLLHQTGARFLNSCLGLLKKRPPRFDTAGPKSFTFVCYCGVLRDKFTLKNPAVLLSINVAFKMGSGT